METRYPKNTRMPAEEVALRGTCDKDLGSHAMTSAASGSRCLRGARLRAAEPLSASRVPRAAMIDGCAGLFRPVRSDDHPLRCGPCRRPTRRLRLASFRVLSCFAKALLRPVEGIVPATFKGE